MKDGPMTRDEINKAIAALTVEIRTLSYSSTKEAADRPWLRLANRPGRSGVHGAGGLCWAWSPSGHMVEAMGDHRGGHGFIIAREAWRRRDLTTKVGGM